MIFQNNFNGTPYPAGGTPIHYLYGYVPPNWVVILKFLIQNGVSISEAFSRTGYNISNARKLQFCKQPFEIIQGQIACKNTVQCVNKQTVVPQLHPVFQRAGWAYFGASVFLERSISFTANSRTGFKKLAHFQNGVSILREIFLERGANLESRAADTHPKNTQVSPRDKPSVLLTVF